MCENKMQVNAKQPGECKERASYSTFDYMDLFLKVHGTDYGILL